MAISRRAFLKGLSTAGIATLAGCDLLSQEDAEGFSIIPPALDSDRPDPNATPTVAPDTWWMGAPMPTPRITVAGAAAHGRIYVIGGWTPEAASNANEAYDPSTDRWQELAPLPRTTRPPRSHRRGWCDISSRRFHENTSPIGRRLALRSLCG